MLYFGVELLQQQGVGAVDENNRELDFLAVLGLKNISYSVDFPDQIEEGLGLVADSFWVGEALADAGNDLFGHLLVFDDSPFLFASILKWVVYLPSRVLNWVLMEVYFEARKTTRIYSRIKFCNSEIV